MHKNKEPHFVFFEESWNQSESTTDGDEGDEDHIDGVDGYQIKEKDTTYYDDYEDYGY